MSQNGMAPVQANKRIPAKIKIPLVLGGVVLAFALVQKLTSPGVPPPEGMDDYTFQPEPRQTIEQPRRPTIDLGASSGALGSASSSAPAPSGRAASCASLQRFANYEYGRRFRNGKLTDLLSFSGFEAMQPSVSESGVITCSGGDYIRRGSKAERRCKNVIITYDTRSNTLSHNVQYRYLESGLVAQCSEGKLSSTR